MAKIAQGSLDGVFRLRMKKFTVEELREWAVKLSSQIADPRNTDDPRWLARWADRLNRLADQKEDALLHKTMQSKRRRGRHRTR